MVKIKGVDYIFKRYFFIYVLFFSFCFSCSVSAGEIDYNTSSFREFLYNMGRGYYETVKRTEYYNFYLEHSYTKDEAFKEAGLELIYSLPSEPTILESLYNKFFNLSLIEKSKVSTLYDNYNNSSAKAIYNDNYVSGEVANIFASTYSDFLGKFFLGDGIYSPVSNSMDFVLKYADPIRIYTPSYNVSEYDYYNDSPTSIFPCVGSMSYFISQANARDLNFITHVKFFSLESLWIERKDFFEDVPTKESDMKSYLEYYPYDTLYYDLSNLYISTWVASSGPLVFYSHNVDDDDDILSGRFVFNSNSSSSMYYKLFESQYYDGFSASNSEIDWDGKLSTVETSYSQYGFKVLDVETFHTYYNDMRVLPDSIVPDMPVNIKPVDFIIPKVFTYPQYDDDMKKVVVEVPKEPDVPIETEKPVEPDEDKDWWDINFPDFPDLLAPFKWVIKVIIDFLKDIIDFFVKIIDFIFSFFSNFLKALLDFLVQLLLQLKDLLISLFVPDENYFELKLNDMQNNLSVKLSVSKSISVINSLSGFYVGDIQDLKFVILNTPVTLPIRDILISSAPFIRKFITFIIGIMLAIYNYNQTLWLIRGTSPINLGSNSIGNSDSKDSKSN